MNRVIFWNAPITISGIECFMSSLSYKGVLRAHEDGQGGETHRLPSCWLLRETSETNTCVDVAFLSWSWINRVKKNRPPVPSWNGWAQSIWDDREPRPGGALWADGEAGGLKDTHIFSSSRECAYPVGSSGQRCISAQVCIFLESSLQMRLKLRH